MSKEGDMLKRINMNPYPVYQYDSGELMLHLRDDGLPCWYGYGGNIIGYSGGYAFELQRGTYRTGIYVEGALCKSVGNASSWKQVIASIKQAIRECRKEHDAWRLSPAGKAKIAENEEIKRRVSALRARNQAIMA